MSTLLDKTNKDFRKRFSHRFIENLVRIFKLGWSMSRIANLLGAAVDFRGAKKSVKRKMFSSYRIIVAWRPFRRRPKEQVKTGETGGSVSREN